MRSGGYERPSAADRLASDFSKLQSPSMVGRASMPSYMLAHR